MTLWVTIEFRCDGDSCDAFFTAPTVRPGQIGDLRTAAQRLAEEDGWTHYAKRGTATRNLCPDCTLIQAATS